MHNLCDQQFLYTYCQSTIFSIKSSKFNLIPLNQLTITHWHKHKTHKHFIGKSQFFMKVQFTNPVLSFDRSTFQQIHEEEEFYGSLRNRKAWESASFDEVKHTDFVTNANERAKKVNIQHLLAISIHSSINFHLDKKMSNQHPKRYTLSHSFTTKLFVRIQLWR